MTLVVNGDCGKLILVPFDCGPCMIEVEKHYKKRNKDGSIVYIPPESYYEGSDDDVSTTEETGCIKISQTSKIYLWVFENYEDACTASRIFRKRICDSINCGARMIGITFEKDCIQITKDNVGLFNDIYDDSPF